jgi:hypothetical protein
MDSHFHLQKTCCIHFYRKHQLHADPVLYLGNIPIPFIESTKFLGLHFDRSLTWKNRITQLHVKSTESLNIFRILSGSSLGVHRVCLLCWFHALVRSVLVYGSIVFPSAASSTLRPFNTIHHGGISLHRSLSNQLH